MKKSETMSKALEQMGGEVRTTGQLRMLACAALTALVKGEITNNDAMAVSKTLDSVAKNLAVEIAAKKLHMQIVAETKTIINPSDVDYKLGNLEIGFNQG
jgi:predicted amino acid-binding ACT domain protein